MHSKITTIILIEVKNVAINYNFFKKIFFGLNLKKVILGCCGTLQGSQLLTGIYGFGTLLMAALIISCCVYLIYAKDAVSFKTLQKAKAFFISILNSKSF